MSDVIEYEYWMQLTNAGMFSVRNNALREVDQALKRFHQTQSPFDKQSTLAALQKWITAEGNNWKHSVRNRYSGIEILQADLTGNRMIQLSAAEQAAWAFIRDESKQVLRKIFHGRTLEWRSGIFSKLKGCLETIYDTGMHMPFDAMTVDSFAKGDDQVFTRRKLAKEIFDKIVPPQVQDAVVKALEYILPDFFEQFAISMIPFIGALHSATGAVRSTAEAIGKQIVLERTQNHAHNSFAHGEPFQATQAMIKILHRERNNAAFGASVDLGAMTAKIVGTLVDGGTLSVAVTGLATASIKLMNMIHIVTRDCLERHHANEMLSKTFDASVFDKCPILGAYMICCAPSSVLMNGLIQTGPSVGWRGKAEHAWKNHWIPLRMEAQELIKNHRFVINSLANSPGVLDVNHENLDKMMKGAA